MRIISDILQLIAPNSCVICEERTMQPDICLCERCNLFLPRTHFAKNAYHNNLSKMFWGRLPIERATALFYYESGSEVSRLIQQMKYFNNPELAENMGYFAAKEFEKDNFFQDINFIIPLPLAPNRQKQRGYNQSEKIAQGVSKFTHIPLLNHVVKRKTFVESQTHKGVNERRENVEDAFQLENKHNLAGKHLLLIDDIITTGATMASFGRALSQIEDIKISIMCLGYTRP